MTTVLPASESDSALAVAAALAAAAAVGVATTLAVVRTAALATEVGAAVAALPMLVVDP
jgi:hypothetical protein